MQVLKDVWEGKEKENTRSLFISLITEQNVLLTNLKKEGIKTPNPLYLGLEGSSFRFVSKLPSVGFKDNNVYIVERDIKEYKRLLAARKDYHILHADLKDQTTQVVTTPFQTIFLDYCGPYISASEEILKNLLRNGYIGNGTMIGFTFLLAREPDDITEYMPSFGRSVSNICNGNSKKKALPAIVCNQTITEGFIPVINAVKTYMDKSPMIFFAITFYSLDSYVYLKNKEFLR